MAKSQIITKKKKIVTNFMQNHSQEKCENQLFCLLQLSLPILTAFGDDVFGHIFLIQCYSVDTDPFFVKTF